MELYYGITLQIYITEWYHGIIVRNHLYEKDPGDAWDGPRAPWDPGDPLGTPLGPARTPLGPQERPWTPRDAPGTSRGRPSHLWGPPVTSYEPQNRSYLEEYTAPEALDCCARSCLSGPIACSTRPDLSLYKKAAKVKKLAPGTGISVRCVRPSRKPHLPVICYMHIYHISPSLSIYVQWYFVYNINNEMLN